MRHSRWTLRYAAAAAAGLAVVTALPTGPASATSNASGPIVKLVTAQKSINVPRYGKRVYLDPGIYVTSSFAPLLFCRPESCSRRSTPSPRRFTSVHLCYQHCPES